jgi:hypothetical protein
MSDSNEVDPNLLEFARQVVAIPRRISEEDGVLAQSTQDTPVLVPAVTPAPTPASEAPKVFPVRQDAPSIELPQNSDKKLRTPDELAQLVLTTLREVEDCPGQGFAITVYGSNPWNALLTIRPEAGPRIDRAFWLSRVQDICAGLRNEFDVAEPAATK